MRCQLCLVVEAVRFRVFMGESKNGPISPNCSVSPREGQIGAPGKDSCPTLGHHGSTE